MSDQHLTQPGQSRTREAGRVIAVQSIVTTLAALLAWGIAGQGAAFAALWGGLTAILPALYLAWRISRVPPDASPTVVVGTFYRGEIGKYALTAVLFGLGVAWFAQWFLPLLFSFMAAQAGYWVAAYLGRN